MWLNEKLKPINDRPTLMKGQQYCIVHTLLKCSIVPKTTPKLVDHTEVRENHEKHASFKEETSKIKYYDLII